jgi:hypothetical protein
MDRKGGLVALACKAADDCTALDGDESQSFTGFNKGVGQTNKLAVVVLDNSLSVFVNGQEVFRTRQAKLSRHGMIGIYARGDKTGNGTETVFSNVKVWQL